MLGRATENGESVMAIMDDALNQDQYFQGLRQFLGRTKTKTRNYSLPVLGGERNAWRIF